MKPNSHDFRGLNFRILWRHPRGYPGTVGGSCTHPGAEKPTIEISPSAKGYQKLNILVDEAIHACVWDLDNDSVAECSDAIASFLWKCGYREIVDE